MHAAESVYKSNYHNSKPNIRMIETYLSEWCAMSMQLTVQF